MITNYELRQRMRRVIKPNLQVLLVIALIVALPGLLTSTVTALTRSDLASFLYAYGIDTSATTQRLLEAMQAYATSREALVNLGMSLWQVLVTPVLTLGLIFALLTLLRGGTAVVATVFARRSSFFRSILLYLLISVKLFAWSLPGAALMVLSAFTNINAFLALASLGSLLMLALMVMALYRYAMALFVLADEPETGVLACIRQSKAMMKGRKLQLFSLEIPYLLGSTLAAMLISSLLGSVIGGTLSMLVQLIFSVYLYGARSAFFEAYSRPDGGMAHAFQADPYHDEMKE